MRTEMKDWTEVGNLFEEALEALSSLSTRLEELELEEEHEVLGMFHNLQDKKYSLEPEESIRRSYEISQLHKMNGVHGIPIVDDDGNLVEL